MKENSIPSEYMVRVQCMTYNHAPYIEDAMNGFCMQETDFPFVCVIVDDASTDGEQEVIKRYLKNIFDLQDDQCFREEDTDDYHLIFARHKTNLNCYFGVLLLKYNHFRKKDKAPYYEKWTKAKYIALCEGDDYWTHPKKLQMQVAVLNEHPECSFSGTGFVVNKRGNKEDMTIYETDNGIRLYGIDKWARLWIAKTLTIMIRSDAYKHFLSVKSMYSHPKDIYLQYHLFTLGKCAYIPLNMGVYNDDGQGIWNSRTYLEQLEWDMFSMQEIYFKNNRDKIVYPHYFKYLKECIFFISDTSKRKDLIMEGIKEARCIKDRIYMIISYFKWFISDLRCKMGLRTRLIKLGIGK